MIITVKEKLEKALADTHYEEILKNAEKFESNPKVKSLSKKLKVLAQAYNNRIAAELTTLGDADKIRDTAIELQDYIDFLNDQKIVTFKWVIGLLIPTLFASGINYFVFQPDSKKSNEKIVKLEETVLKQEGQLQLLVKSCNAK